MFRSFSCCICSGTSLLARIPPCTAGCKVFTLPSRHSGKPVTSEIPVTSIPASSSFLCVPPVDITCTPSCSSSLANSTTPVLSDTLINALIMKLLLSIPAVCAEMTLINTYRFYCILKVLELEAVESELFSHPLQPSTYALLCCRQHIQQAVHL